MKLITILFLCSRLIPSWTLETVSEQIDCNNEDVFKVVDTALKKYNDQSQSGNQFVLYLISQVIKMEDSGTFYTIKYEIKEGDCPVHSGKTWQDCDFSEAADAATGECTATVKKGTKKMILATQTCHITPAEGAVVTTQYNCFGCVHPISTESPDLEPVLRYAIQHFNNNTEHSHLFVLHKIKSAKRQVVAGWNYEIAYSIAQTNCSKGNFLFLTPECTSIQNGDSGECRDLAHVDTQLRIVSLSQNCDLYPAEEFVLPRICPGCPKEIGADDPGLQEALDHSIIKLNAENNATFYFKMDSVKKATVQVVAGKKYSIVFTAKETMCSKENKEELLTKSCDFNTDGKALECKADVYVIPWERKVYPTVNCKAQVLDALRKRPPGFSPFRAAGNQAGTKVTTVSPPHTSMASVQAEEQDPKKDQRPTRGHSGGHGKPLKHGIVHGHKHEHDQGHEHQRGHGFGHEHQQQHGLGHGHERGHGHGKHKHKGKTNEKPNGGSTEHLASLSEDSTTSSAQTREKTEGPTLLPFFSQPVKAVTVSDFEDSDLFAPVTSSTPPPLTEDDDDWIPDIQLDPNSLPFNLIADFSETTSPACPGRPWKPVNRMKPAVEAKEFNDFDLADAL
ncbi:PREDICTED: kininogen-2-like [Elephantulus edwardii]|uniref:kininogen-2-like n=1 Tax=Elephantulus edwardii TaxID=28737 RepID=UPI0003F09341|nr:PREDICTED: kininogen-2-like [Elephantulus edwardii]